MAHFAAGGGHLLLISCLTCPGKGGTYKLDEHGDRDVTFSVIYTTKNHKVTHGTICNIYNIFLCIGLNSRGVIGGVSAGVSCHVTMGTGMATDP